MQRIDSGEHPDPQALPDRQRRLHKRAMAAIRSEREQRTPPSLDEEGRPWPGLANQQRRSRSRPSTLGEPSP